MSLVLELATPADTERLGWAVAACLRAGDVVVLSGPLGAGKTVLAQGIGAGLGVRGPVTSPTFVIARVPGSQLDSRLATGMIGLRGDRNGRERPDRPISPALVLRKATPQIRSANSSGSCSANAMIVIPPRECPISTTRPSGAAAWITVCRSRPSCSMVHAVRGDRPERPWLRWS